MPTACCRRVRPRILPRDRGCRFFRGANQGSLAKYLEAKLAQSRDFATCAPVALNIVCFGVKGSQDGSLNREIVIDLHEQGDAAPSLTLLDGKPVIRAAIVNHRTKTMDIDHLIDVLGASLARVKERQRTGSA